jgi:uncharacterized protein YndB with AHSA1/START domain
MPILCQSVELTASPALVYDYVTRPKRWKEWHHSSLAVQEVGEESLVAGRKFEEDVQAAGGLQRHLFWTVEDSQPAKRWRATAYMSDGSTVRLTYDFSASGTGTRFTRTLEYEVGTFFLRWLGKLFMAGKIEKESVAALENLRQHFAKPL